MTLKLRSLDDSQKAKGEESHTKSFSFFLSPFKIPSVPNFLLVFVPTGTDTIDVIVGLPTPEVTIFDLGLVIVLRVAHLEDKGIHITQPHIRVLAIFLC